ncbi:hypothetical protein ACFOOM_12195 [Streptomyces echinoruber]|uniref:Lipoprotein n=1 Tax=Streptomyces echinoruber TaxID=68898 RepID=A0A918RL70_9ACTN|nr:hypothetical protein [Streptomyces echinoruber]GHA01387.1 hypothetical protein GCM10010389_45930 [Streptomyces echinoruber]
MQARTALTAIAILAATLSACGSSDSDSKSVPTKAATTEATEAPVPSSAAPETTAPAEEAPKLSPTTEKPDKYEQTWKRPYSNTTCGDFLSGMNGHERWVTAADMLSAARRSDGGSGLPADSEITRFQKDMSAACEGSADAKVTEIGAALYLMDPTYKP